MLIFITVSALVLWHEQRVLTRDGWRWLAWLTGLPGLHWLADRAYRLDQGKAVLTLDRMAPAGEQKDAPAAFG